MFVTQVRAPLASCVDGNRAVAAQVVLAHVLSRLGTAPRAVGRALRDARPRGPSSTPPGDLCLAGDEAAHEAARACLDGDAVKEAAKRVAKELDGLAQSVRDISALDLVEHVGAWGAAPETVPAFAAACLELDAMY